MRMRRRDATQPIDSTKLLALVLAGGNGTRLHGLTERRAKPAVPFGTHFRIVDFTLSNCRNSGLSGIAVLTQYQPRSLIRHVAQHWRNDGDCGTVDIWPAQRVDGGRYAGTADAVLKNRALIEAIAPENVLIVAGDHVYAMDYAEMLDEHTASGAEVTVSCAIVPAVEARHFGVVEVDANSRVTGFTEKPRSATALAGTHDSVLASMGIYLFRTRYLLDILEADARDPASSHDFGRDILPALIEMTDVRAHRFCEGGDTPAYWRDVGTIDSYWSAHRELLQGVSGVGTDGGLWPVRSTESGSEPVQLTPTANVAASQLGAYSSVAGHVTWSVVSTGCRIGSASTVSNSVLLPGATIGRDCFLDRVVVDSRCRIPDGTIIDAGRRGAADWLSRRFHVSPEGVVLVTQSALEAAAGALPSWRRLPDSAAAMPEQRIA